AGAIVAHITLGFWVRCFAGIYENELWHPHLKRLFPDRRIRRRQVDTSLKTVLLIRNRVAHHEPILPDNAELAIEALKFVLTNLRIGDKGADTPAVLKICETSLSTIKLRIAEMRALMNFDYGN